MTENTKYRLRLGRPSIKRKQTLVILLTSCVSLLLACAGFVAYEVITFRQTMVDNLSTLGDIVANNSTAALQFNVQKGAAENLAMLRSERSIEAGWILSRDGGLFAQYQARPDSPHSFPVLLMGEHRF